MTITNEELASKLYLVHLKYEVNYIHVWLKVAARARELLAPEPITDLERAAIAAIPPPASTGRTVDVRVAVSMDRDGDWVASGWKGATDAAAIDASAKDVAAPVSVTWLTATLSVPEAVEVAAATETTKAP